MRNRARGLLILYVGLLLLLSGCREEEINSKAQQTVALALGESYAIQGTEVTLQVEEAYETEELNPSAPSGYFYYYEDKEGYHYYVVKGKLKNPSRIALKALDFGGAAISGRKEYETKVLLEGNSGATIMKVEDETAASELIFYILVMVEDGKDVPDTVELYYNTGLREKGEKELWDYGLVIQSASMSSGEKDIENTKM